MAVCSNCYPSQLRGSCPRCGRDGGGEIVAWVPPEDIVKAPRSYTGNFLKPVLEKACKTRKRGGMIEAAE